jgi:hypothetical protein
MITELVSPASGWDVYPAKPRRQLPLLGLREMYLNLREANAALRDAIVRGETIQAKDVINLSRDVSRQVIKATPHNS